MMLDPLGRALEALLLTLLLVTLVQPDGFLHATRLMMHLLGQAGGS